MSEPSHENGDSPCICKRPADNDQGICLGCGRWINYRSDV